MHTQNHSGQTPRPSFRLKDADQTLRLFLTAFIVVMSLGYAVGLLFVDHTTSISPQGIAEEFRGSTAPDAGGEMKFEMSPYALYTLIHNHVLSLSLMFLCLGGIFFFSSLVPERWKRILLIEPFLAVATTFGGIALVRFVATEFTWLVLLSGLSLLLSYGAMVVLILVELWSPRSR